MAWSALVSMELDDEEKYDLSQERGFETDYPPGLRFTVHACCFGALEIGDGYAHGSSTRFAAMATVMAINIGESDCRVELQIEMLSLGDGPFVDLDRKPFVCFSRREMDRLDLDSDCERGDLLHMNGLARIVEIDKPREDFGGEDSITLQIEQIAIENESDDA